jgi:hypothetical protein
MENVVKQLKENKKQLYETYNKTTQHPNAGIGLHGIHF